MRDRKEASEWGAGELRELHDRRVALLNELAELEAALATAEAGAEADDVLPPSSPELAVEREALLAEAETVVGLGSFVWDVVTDEVQWSDGLFRLLGHEPGSFAASSDAWFEHVHPDDRERMQRESERQAVAGDLAPFTVRVVRGDGRVRTVTLAGRTVPDADGNFRRIVGTVLDVTDQEHQVAALEHSAWLLGQLEQLTDMGTWELELQSRHMVWSEQLTTMLELGPHEEPGSEAWDGRLHPDVRDEFRAASEAAERGEGAWPTEATMVLPSGRILHLTLNTQLLTGRDGRPDRVVGAVQNATARHRARAELEAVAEELAEAQSIAKVGSWRLDLATQKVTWSDQMYEFYGVSKASYTPTITSPYDFLHPDDHAAMRAAERQGLATGEVTPFEYRLLPSGGGMRRLFMETRAMRDTSGAVTGFRGTVKDITDQHALEQQLSQAAKMEAIGRLAGGVAHDFNNLLTAILGNAQLLDVLHPCEEVDEILLAAGDAATLTSQLLAFSRHAVSTRESVAAEALIDDSLDMFSRLIGEDVILSSVHALDGWHVWADASLLRQALLNLVVNARDAMPDGGTLTFRTDRLTLVEGSGQEHPDLPPGDYVRIQVSDDGIGMDEQTIDHIFEPFFTTKSTGKGTGLGLPTVFGTLRQFGGTITVQSELGKGTTFELVLPRSTHAPAEDTNGPTAIDTEGRGEHILLVEDDTTVRSVTARILESASYKVIQAALPSEAKSLWEDSRTAEVSLIISDVIMPEQTGPSLVRELLRARPGITVLYISGYAPEERLGTDALDAPLLQKPYKSEELLLRVRAVLERRDLPANVKPDQRPSA